MAPLTSTAGTLTIHTPAATPTLNNNNNSNSTMASSSSRHISKDINSQPRQEQLPISSNSNSSNHRPPNALKALISQLRLRLGAPTVGSMAASNRHMLQDRHIPTAMLLASPPTSKTSTPMVEATTASQRRLTATATIETDSIEMN